MWLVIENKIHKVIPKAQLAFISKGHCSLPLDCGCSSLVAAESFLPLTYSLFLKGAISFPDDSSQGSRIAGPLSLRWLWLAPRGKNQCVKIVSARGYSQDKTRPASQCQFWASTCTSTRSTATESLRRWVWKWRPILVSILYCLPMSSSPF